MRIKSFLMGAISGGLAVWFWKDAIRDLLDEQARAMRTQVADRLHGVEETAEEVFDRAAAPLKRVEEALDRGRAQVSANLNAVERTIRP